MKIIMAEVIAGKKSMKQMKEVLESSIHYYQETEKWIVSQEM